MSFITFNNLSRFEQGIKNILSQVLGGLSSTVGNSTLNTAAQNLTGAINEHEVDIGDMDLETTAEDLTGAINETHDVLQGLLDLQELYKPLIATESELLPDFAEGSYLMYGKLNGELIFFIKVSKTTAMSGTTDISALPAEYQPAGDNVLATYDTDGKIFAGAYIGINGYGEVYIEGDVGANTVILASYKGEPLYD